MAPRHEYQGQYTTVCDSYPIYLAIARRERNLRQDGRERSRLNGPRCANPPLAFPQIGRYGTSMANAIKMTFTLDQATADRIDRTARRLGVPKSGVVREAIAEYAANAGSLTDAERTRMLGVLDHMMAQPPTRTAAAVDREIEGVRAARRAGGRRSQSRDTW